MSRIQPPIITALLLLLFMLPGCGGVRATPSPVGDYDAGSIITLASGADLTVPAGWRAEVRTSGALVDQAPEDTGILGGQMYREGSSDSLAFSVYGPEAGLRKRLDELTDAVEKGAPLIRTRKKLPDRAVVTGFVGRQSEGNLDIVVSVVAPDDDPLLIVASLENPPKDLAGVDDESLPQALLDYLHFEQRR